MAVCLLAACTSRKSDPVQPKADPAPRQADTTAVSDSLASAHAPKGADGLFDDFIYVFMHDAAFQRSRVKFPLKNLENGKNRPIARADWTFDPLYSRLEIYTVLLDGEKGTAAEKDTALRHVTVEWVHLKEGRVKRYVFNKENGRWLLVAIDAHALAQNDNSDFYKFYHRFSTDMAYQARHIANPFEFHTYDPDTNRPLEGLLDAAQWPDFRPELPAGRIANINYGQGYANSRLRVFMICSVSGGMGCSLTFKKTGDQWRLERLDN